MGLYQRDNGVWYARWTKRGKLYRQSLGTTSRREAEAQHRQLTGTALNPPPALEAQVLVERWRYEYNTFRPHSAPGVRWITKTRGRSEAPPSDLLLAHGAARRLHSPMMLMLFPEL